MFNNKIPLLYERMLIALSFIVLSFELSAQWNYSAVVGFSQRFNIFQEVSLSRPLSGFNVGIIADYNFKQYPFLTIETGLIYRYAGLHNNDHTLFPNIQVAEGHRYKEYADVHALSAPCRM